MTPITNYAAKISTNNFKSASKKFEFCTKGITIGAK